MRTENEIKARIRKFEKDYSGILRGRYATLEVNGPRALMQISAEQTLGALYGELNDRRNQPES